MASKLWMSANLSASGPVASHPRTETDRRMYSKAGIATGFIFGGTITIASIGFALAFGVLADAFLIRMTFVPAVHTLLGDRAWHLPRWIDRILPNVTSKASTCSTSSATGPRSTRPTPEATRPDHERGADLDRIDTTGEVRPQGD